MESITKAMGLIEPRFTNKIPATKNRVRTALALAFLYGTFSTKYLRGWVHSLLKMHPNWAAMKGRAGMFNPSAQDEVVYVVMQGLHHALGAFCFKKAQELKAKDDEEGSKEEATFGPFNWRGLSLFGACWEYGYEWFDFFVMITGRWPYEKRDAMFAFLLTMHHSFGILTFFCTGLKQGYSGHAMYMSEQVLGVASACLLLYPMQQLCNLNTKGGLQAAIVISTLNAALTAWARFYVFPVYGFKFMKEAGFLKEENRSSTSTKLMLGGGAALMVFNVLVGHGFIQKTMKYVNALNALK